VVLAAQENTKEQQHYSIPVKLPAGVFRAYDIRGEVGPDSINENLGYAIGLAVASEAKALNKNEIIVGRDGRLSGPSIKAALVKGILTAGCDVIDIGVGPTPLVYFATCQTSVNSGVMVTASHNPGHHNGFKIVLDGKTITSDHIQKLYRRIEQQDFTTGQGKITQLDIQPQYMDYVIKQCKLSRPLKVVIDAGNGAGGELAPTLYRALGAEVIELFCDIDGHFPNHHPDPTIPENLQDLIEAVKREQADLGLAFDGDADRMGLVTDQGEIIWPDRQMMLFSEEVLSQYPGAKIVFDVKCSANLPKHIAKFGGDPIMYRTGHSILKQKMIETNAKLAGERSGHIFFRDGWFGFDDGIYVGARLMHLLANGNKKISDIFAALPNSINTPEIKIPMPEDRKAKFMQDLENNGDFGEEANIITVDGLRIEFPFGWGLVRPSNTSPNLTLRFEADTHENLARVKSIFHEELLAIDPTLKLPF